MSEVPLHAPGRAGQARRQLMNSPPTRPMQSYAPHPLSLSLSLSHTHTLSLSLSLSLSHTWSC